MNYKYEKPIFRISKSRVLESYDSLKEIFDQVSYSWKTNPVVGDILNKETKAYSSIHSLNELEEVENKDRCWYFLFIADKNEIDKLLKEYKIKNFVIEREEDLNLLLGRIKTLKKKVNVLLRMKLGENTMQRGKHYVFGMSVDKIKELIEKLDKENLVEEKGIHFHRKTQNVSEWSLNRDVLNSLGEDFLEKINLINVGGGIPSRYKNVKDVTIDNIFSKLKEFKEEMNKRNIKVIGEPGRYIASFAAKLETRVLAVEGNTIFLNASIFSGALDTVVANIKLLVEGERDEGQKYLLKGITPDSADILRYSVCLDKPPKVGDKLVFLNAGAYNYYTNFCSLNPPEVVIEE